MSVKLQSLQQCLEEIQASQTDESIVLLTDTETFIAFLPNSHININIPVGTPVSQYKGTLTEKALRTGKKLSEERGPENFGVPYVSIATPIYEDGTLVGCLTIVKNSEQMEKIRTASSQLASTVEEMTATADQVAEASVVVHDQVHSLSGESKHVSTEIEKIRTVLSFVNDIASQSHMLGLNAAIEAARAGEHGRGFSIVANEIRKMATQSKQAAEKIHSQLQSIESSMKKMNVSIQSVTSQTQNHSASIQELRAAFEHIAVTATELYDHTHS